MQLPVFEALELLSYLPLKELSKPFQKKKNNNPTPKNPRRRSLPLSTWMLVQKIKTIVPG